MLDSSFQQFQLSSSPPEIEETLFNICDFSSVPLSQSASKSRHKSKSHMKVSRLPKQHLSQAQRRSLRYDDKLLKPDEPILAKPHFKGWAVIPLSTSEESFKK